MVPITIHKESVAGFTGGVLSLKTGELPDRDKAMAIMAVCGYDFIEYITRINILDSPLFKVTHSYVTPMQSPSSPDIIAIPACSEFNMKPYNGTYVHFHGPFKRNTLSMVTVKMVYLRNDSSLIDPTREYNKVELFQALGLNTQQ